ncbi:MAG: hypothetical protein ACPG31_01720 [Planctomycetota bacterium]
MAAAAPLVLSPGFAGGRLRMFNLLLRAAPTTPLILDENLFGAADLRFPVQNAHGDVVSLEVPDHGKLSVGSRAAFTNALLDTLPPTARGAEIVEGLLPEPLMTPLEAAAHQWQSVFPGLAVECIKRGAASPPKTDINANITWASARHIQAMKELGLTEELVLQGESACQATMVPIPAGALGEETEALRESLETKLAAMKPLSEQVDPSLVGAWVRLRRNLRESLDEFASRADKCGRNRGGIRRTRLHSLAQAWRPHDQAQELGLTLLSAVCSFQLNLSNIDGYRTTLGGCVGRESVLRTS